MPEVLQFEFGASFKSFLGMFGFLKFDLLSGISLGCSLTSNLYTKFAMSRVAQKLNERKNKQNKTNV